MSLKITIETWNDGWRFEIEDKDDGDILKSGECETYIECVAKCVEFIAKNGPIHKSPRTQKTS